MGSCHAIKLYKSIKTPRNPHVLQPGRPNFSCHLPVGNWNPLNSWLFVRLFVKPILSTSKSLVPKLLAACNRTTNQLHHLADTASHMFLSLASRQSVTGISKNPQIFATPYPLRFNPMASGEVSVVIQLDRCLSSVLDDVPGSPL